VEPVPERERRGFAELAVDAEAFRRGMGAPWLRREAGCTLLEQRWTQPTLDIHYLAGGSPRTVIPARSRAALWCRLVATPSPPTA
jgi:hypothetical protein